MRIYTSYYKRFEKIGPAYTLIQISNSKPKWFNWEIMELWEVYPDWSWVSGLKNGTMTQEEYEVAYRGKLSRLDKNTILRKIRDIAGGNEDNDIILLCWEAPDKFCHRHILADWLGGVTEWET